MIIFVGGSCHIDGRGRSGESESVEAVRQWMGPERPLGHSWRFVVQGRWLFVNASRVCQCVTDGAGSYSERVRPSAGRGRAGVCLMCVVLKCRGSATYVPINVEQASRAGSRRVSRAGDAAACSSSLFFFPLVRDSIPALSPSQQKKEIEDVLSL